MRPVREFQSKGEVDELPEKLKKYLNSEESSVSWQLEYIRKTYKQTEWNESVYLCKIKHKLVYEMTLTIKDI